MQDMRWRRLDIATLVEGAPVERPDLSRVDEIGWSTLMTGGGTPASSRVDWIAVYARAVPREPAAGALSCGSTLPAAPTRRARYPPR